MRVLGEDAPTSMAFSLMYSLKARSFRERYQKIVQQNINRDNPRHLLKIFDSFILQRSLKKKWVSHSDGPAEVGGSAPELELREDSIVRLR